jgi:cytochrome P450
MPPDADRRAGRASVDEGEDARCSFPSLDLSNSPYEFYESARAGPAVWPVVERGEFLVARYEDVDYALRHPEIFSNRTLGADPNQMSESAGRSGMLLSDPPEHGEKRALVAAQFKARRLDEREDRIRELAHELIDGFFDKGEVDFVAAFAEPLPVLVAIDMMGLNREDWSQLLRWGAVDGPGTSYLPQPLQAAARDKTAKLQAYLRAVVCDRLASPRDDLLGVLIAGHLAVVDEVDIGYLVAEAASLLSGASNTTAHAIALAMFLVLRDGQLRERVLEDLSLIPAAFEEALRLESPVQWIPRTALIGTELGGVMIPAGSRVLLLLASANRDGAVFDQPSRFDIDRPNPRRHLAFSQGPHFCLGAPLARMEARIALETALTRLRDVELSDLETPGFVRSTFHRGLQALQLRFASE